MLPYCIELYRRLMNGMDRDVADASVDPERHLGNPFNAYNLIKRLSTDWPRAENHDIRNRDARGVFTRGM